MGSARQVATVCIRAPSLSIPDPTEEDGEQTEPGVIGYVSRRVEGRELCKVAAEVSMD
ncbi:MULTISPECIES: hypothetical protein [unclassified Pseudomonas]|uniref:hypothetical protein n=1 Tax=unclassified Pseudomonas TaxID=196821 RepID=UPI0010CFF208|nr:MULTISPECIES: hypothetical protein [unclassified Pseudomonas]VII91680.1 hypothetical protein [Pseudomonas sp. FG-3G]